MYKANKNKLVFFCTYKKFLYTKVLVNYVLPLKSMLFKKYR